MKYNESSFFENDKVYTFLTPQNKIIESQVEYYNGSWFTLNPLFSSYKATSLKSKPNESN